LFKDALADGKVLISGEDLKSLEANVLGLDTSKADDPERLKGTTPRTLAKLVAILVLTKCELDKKVGMGPLARELKEEAKESGVTFDEYTIQPALEKAMGVWTEEVRKASLEKLAREKGLAKPKKGTPSSRKS
jgi:hypothetical protein